MKPQKMIIWIIIILVIVGMLATYSSFLYGGAY